MIDGDMEVILVLNIGENVATVQLPDTSVEDWSLAVLPTGTLPGDQVGVTVTAGDLDLVLLPRPRGLPA